MDLRRRAARAFGVAAGLGAAILCVSLAGQMGGTGGAAPSTGDVDGSGEMNITDAIYLLNYLFKGGPPPVDCPGGTSTPLCKFRFFNDIVCNNLPVVVTMTACETTFGQSTTDAWTTCIDAKAGKTCLVRVSANTQDCGAFCFESSIPLVDGHIYNFVISVDDLGLFVIWFDQQGDCATAPPTGGDPVTGEMAPCPGAAGVGAGGSCSWTSAGSWGR